METQLSDIVATLAVTAPILVERRRQREEEHRRWEAARHQRCLAKQARLRDENQWQQFLTFAQRSEQAKRARAFIQELESRLEDADEVVNTTTLGAWLAWAQQWANQYDPLNGSVRALFEQIAAVEADTSQTAMQRHYR